MRRAAKPKVQAQPKPQASPQPSSGLLGELQAQQHTLAGWAARYLAEQVYGVQSLSTLEAKTRDLSSFVRWFVAANGHGSIERWVPSDTQMYLGGLKQQGRAPATLNRILATLRHFARWAHEQPGGVFRKHGLPTRGIEAAELDPTVVEPLTENEVRALFAAADARAQTDSRKNGRPRRNKAILSTLFLTGLRVSELVSLRFEQYQGDYLHDVVRKGRNRKQKIYLVAECRAALDAYVQHERAVDDKTSTAKPLFLPSNKHAFMTRQQIGKILDQLAADASAGKPELIGLHPTRLRHTFGYALRTQTGSDAATAAALGHSGVQYVARYSEADTRKWHEVVMDRMSSTLIEGEPAQLVEKTASNREATSN